MYDGNKVMEEIDKYLEIIEEYIEAERLGDAAINIRHILEAIVDGYTEIELPSMVFAKTIDKIESLSKTGIIKDVSTNTLHQIRILANKGAHKKGNDLSLYEIKKMIAPLKMEIECFRKFLEDKKLYYNLEKIKERERIEKEREERIREAERERIRKEEENRKKIEEDLKKKQEYFSVKKALTGDEIITEDNVEAIFKSLKSKGDFKIFNSIVKNMEGKKGDKVEEFYKLSSDIYHKYYENIDDLIDYRALVRNYVNYAVIKSDSFFTYMNATIDRGEHYEIKRESNAEKIKESLIDDLYSFLYEQSQLCSDKRKKYKGISFWISSEEKNLNYYYNGKLNVIKDENGEWKNIESFFFTDNCLYGLTKNKELKITKNPILVKNPERFFYIVKDNVEEVFDCNENIKIIVKKDKSIVIVIRESKINLPVYKELKNIMEPYINDLLQYNNIKIINTAICNGIIVLLLSNGKVMPLITDIKLSEFYNNNYKDIIWIDGSNSHLLMLNINKTVEAIYYNSSKYNPKYYASFRGKEKWRNVVAIYAYNYFSIGITESGEIILNGYILDKVVDDTIKMCNNYATHIFETLKKHWEKEEDKFRLRCSYKKMKGEDGIDYAERLLKIKENKKSAEAAKNEVLDCERFIKEWSENTRIDDEKYDGLIVEIEKISKEAKEMGVNLN